MKVVLVSPYSWSVPGGVANHIEALAGRLRSRGHEVVIVAPAEEPIPRGIVAVGRSVGIPFNGSVARLAFGPRVATRIRRILRDAKPDIVHVHEPFAPSASMLAAMLSRAPLVATFHAAAPQSALYRVASRVLGGVWRKLAARIAVSEEARRAVERAFGSGVRIIPNGIALERFSAIPAADPSSKQILFIGRLEPRKGAGVLLDALPHVLRIVPEASVRIVGEGAERRSLERRAEGLDVRFDGRVAPEDLAAAMASAAVVCVPSLGGESFGIVLLEAMAAGRPVVATSIPGYAAVARDGIDALLVPPRDAVRLGEALARVLTDADLAASLARAGRERASRYSWDVVADEIEQVYRDAAR